MPDEHFFGASGKETDTQGIPFVEIAERPVLRHWRFLRWLFHDRFPEPTHPQISLPDPPIRRSQLEMRGGIVKRPDDFYQEGI